METFNTIKVTGVFLVLVQVVCFIVGVIFTTKFHPFSRKYDIGSYLLAFSVVIGPIAIFLL